MGVSLDRRAALELWRVVTLSTVRADGPDLTQRQLAVLLTIYLTPPPHTVRGLAEILNVGKPAITRAIDTLAGLKLVRRRRDEADGRNVLLQRTQQGTAFMSEFGDLVVRRASAIPAVSPSQGGAERDTQAL
jgi:DNA-binding MarR family transcriptional regulator